MKTTSNTILITGGGSGIGRGLAESFHALGNQVIIAGRRKAALEETVAANPGMKSAELDIEDAEAVREFAARIAGDYPALNVLLNNAGIMRVEKLLSQPGHLAEAEATIATNLLGPLRLTSALLPHLQKQPAATIINVSSGLAFLPLALTPTYSASKAAIHSYSEALRYQLRDTSTQVIEIIPPAVATGLLPGTENSPHAMPLKAFIAETMNLLTTQPDAPEICVEGVKMLRFSASSGQYETIFKNLNEMAARMAP